MDTTLFLAGLWGPVIFAMGLGIFISRNYYVKAYRELEKETLAVLLYGIVGVVIGILQISAHNVWDTLPQFIISLLGWGVLLKGAVFIVAPRFADKSGDAFLNAKLLSTVGVVMLVLGGYLSWFAYLV
ncbi:MAG TPA: hypothetical protein PLF31_02490 [Candidatus Paceibacterota bacterium]|nr:hypothetical protein [Candidatus Paceibacterota bacterium]